jgi:hypothetical protein
LLIIQAFRGDSGVSTDLSGPACKCSGFETEHLQSARLSPVCEGARFYQA